MQAFCMISSDLFLHFLWFLQTSSYNKKYGKMSSEEIIKIILSTTELWDFNVHSNLIILCCTCSAALLVKPHLHITIQFPDEEELQAAGIMTTNGGQGFTHKYNFLLMMIMIVTL